MSTDETREKQPDLKTGAEEAFEDFFGLNLRSLRTIAALIKRPATYFQSAKSPDWNNQSFTPSARLWLGLTAIIVALRFIWGGENSAYFKRGIDTLNEEAMKQPGGSELAAIDWAPFFEKLLDIQAVLSPICTIATLFILATFLRFWGEPLSYVTRLRYLFIAVLPMSLITIIYFLIASVMPSASTSLGLVIYSFIVFLAVLSVVGRGGMIAVTGKKKWGRSIAMTSIIYGAIMSVEFVMLLIVTVSMLVKALN